MIRSPPRYTLSSTLFPFATRFLSQRRDPRQVVHRVIGDHFVERQRAREELHRCPADARETTIDAADRFFDIALQLAVYGHLLGRRYADRDQRDLADQLWMLVEQLLERTEFYQRALGVGEPFDRQDPAVPLPIRRANV